MRYIPNWKEDELADLTKEEEKHTQVTVLNKLIFPNFFCTHLVNRYDVCKLSFQYFINEIGFIEDYSYDQKIKKVEGERELQIVTEDRR